MLRELEAGRDAGVDALVAVDHSDHREVCAHDREWPFRIINILEMVGASMGLHRLCEGVGHPLRQKSNSSPVTTVKPLWSRGGRVGPHAAGAHRDLCNLLANNTRLAVRYSVVIVSIQSPVGEPRMKRQLDPDQEASEGPIIKAEERPQ